MSPLSYYSSISSQIFLTRIDNYNFKLTDIAFISQIRANQV